MKIEILEDITGVCSPKIKGEPVPFLTAGEIVELISNTANDVLIVEKENKTRYPVRIEKTSLWKNQISTQISPLNVTGKIVNQKGGLMTPAPETPPTSCATSPKTHSDLKQREQKK